MTTLTFYKGELPSTPMVIVVTDAMGDPLNLEDVTNVSLYPPEGFPAGVCSVSDTAGGKVQYDFTEPFDAAQTFVLQVQMVSGDKTDLSAPFSVTVLDPIDLGATIVTPIQVEGWTGTSVSQQQVVQAQYQISLIVGADIFDEVWLATLSSKDTYWLSLAVAYQAADISKVDASTSQISVPYLPGVKSVATGDQQITFGTAQDTSGVDLRASAAVKHLSWMRPVRTLRAKPFLRSLSSEEAAEIVVNGFGYRP